MEAKLKSLRVADLRELLQKASVAIPAKSNKSDLIAKILANPGVVDAFNNQGTSIPVVSKPKAPEPTQGGQDDDLLAPPEEFDWDPTSASNEAPASSSGVIAENAVSASSNHVAEKTATLTGVSERSASLQRSSAPFIGAAEPNQDDESERRKKRAARFGIPLVGAMSKTTPISNPTIGSQSDTKLQNAPGEEAAKIEARAARFGVPKATTKSAGTGQKRTRSPAAVDTEEMEKRKKRAERFATGGEAKAQT